MTAPFSLSSIDSASLEWPDLPGADTRLDMLAPTPPVPPGSTQGLQKLGACIDELAATKALTRLLDARVQAAHDRADMCLRATFTIECSPAERVTGRPVPACIQYRDVSGLAGHGHVNAYDHSQQHPDGHAEGRHGGRACSHWNGKSYGSLYGITKAEFPGLHAEGSPQSRQSWLANLAPLATLALLLGAWFIWLR